jgi:uroporphyrinogen decarboxylase
MTHRERLEASLKRTEPDRIPLDIGGSVVTSISKYLYESLVSELCLEKRTIRVENVYSQTAFIDDDVHRVLGIDTRAIHLKDPSGHMDNIKREAGKFVFTDEWDITWAMPESSCSGYMAIKHPLANASLPTDIDRFPWPDGANPARFKGVEEEVKKLSETQQFAVIAETNIGGVYEWPGFLRGLNNWLVDLASDSDMVEAMLEKITEFKVAFWEALLSRIGKYVSMVRESDDLAGQNGLLISPEYYRKYFKPRHRIIVETIKKYTDAPVFLHSCGGIWDLIPDLIEAGFDGLNPIQVGTYKMNPLELKKMYGKELLFWGGSCDSQQLPTMIPAQVKEQARRNIEALAPGGGFIFAPINMLQADVPPENIVAMAEAVSEYI